MKRFMIGILTISALFAGIVGTTNTYAEPGIGVGLVLKDAAGNINDSFVMGDDIIVILSLDNIPEPGEPEVDVWTSNRFSRKKFHLLLQFVKEPEKELITAMKQTGIDAPPPLSIPIIVDGKPVVLQAEEVERLEAGWAITVGPFNAYDFYKLTQPGRYTVRAVIPLRTYPAGKIQAVAGKTIAELADRDFEGFIASNLEPFTIEALPGDLNADGCVDLEDYALLMNDIRGAGPHDMSHDLNGDGVVSRADARTLIGLFSNPNGAACK